MTFTLKKSIYDGLAGWKWRALKHVMGDLVLGIPAGLDDENPILDENGDRLVVFSDSRFDGEKAAALRLVIEAMDFYDDNIIDSPEKVLSSLPEKGAMVPEWIVNQTYSMSDLVFYNGRVWRCIQSHTSQADLLPNESINFWTGYRSDTDQ